MVFFVYKLTFTNGKIYIGMSRTDARGSFETRYKEHDYAARIGKDLPVYNAWRKYGAPSKEILSMHASKKECAQFEQDAILCYSATKQEIGYNITRGGDGLHVERGSQTHQRIGAKTWNNPEWCAEMSKRFKGRDDPRSADGKARAAQNARTHMTTERAVTMRATAHANPDTVAKFDAGRKAWRESNENADHCRRIAKLAAEASTRAVVHVATGIEYPSCKALADAMGYGHQSYVSRLIAQGKVRRV